MASEFTLGHLALHPARQAYDISDRSVKSVGATVQAYMKTQNESTCATPDRMAVTFYAFSQMIGYLSTIYDRSEPLPTEDAEVLKRYLTFMNSEGVRAAVYLLLITVRESRHTKPNDLLDKVIAKDVGPEAVAWIRAHKGHSENYADLWNAPPNCTLGQLVRGVKRFFYEGPFSSGYGGPAWGKITDCLHDYVHGLTSAEMMMDTNWTLAHNNGPIFNKGMLYNGYKPQLVQILDVQRAGMIMQGILETHKVMDYAISPAIRNIVAKFMERHPRCIDKPYIDWFQVENLGALYSYGHFQKEQQIAHGPSPHMTDKQAALNKYEEELFAPPPVAPPPSYYQVDTKLQVPIVKKIRPKTKVLVAETTIPYEPIPTLPDVIQKLLDGMLVIPDTVPGGDKIKHQGKVFIPLKKKTP